MEYLTMPLISMKTYTDLLYALNQTCEAADVPLNPQQQETITNFRTPESQKILENLPPSTFKEIAKKVSEYTNDKLLLYFAAKNLKLEPLANKFLSLWQKELNDEVTYELEGPEDDYLERDPDSINTNNFPPPTSEKIDTLILQMLTKIHLPPLGKAAEDYAQEISGGLKHIIAKEIVFQAFQNSQPNNTPPAAIPPHVQKHIWSFRTCSSTKYVLKKYAYLQKSICSEDFGKNYFYDSDIKKSFKRFPDAIVVSLKDCLKLTKDCLSKGHPNLEKLILTGTRIQESEVPKQLFPKLEVIIQEEHAKIYDLEYPYDSTGVPTPLVPVQWIQFRQEIEKASIVLAHGGFLYRLFEQFELKPSFESLETLIAIERNANKFRDNSQISSYKKQLYESFVTIFERSPMENLENSNSVEKKIFKNLMNALLDPNFPQNIKQSIGLSFHKIGLPDEQEKSRYNRQRNQPSKLSSVCLEKDKKAQFLIKEGTKEKRMTLILENLKEKGRINDFLIRSEYPTWG
jgi:hypothetical protein